MRALAMTAAAVVLGISLFGCSQQARDEYGAAGKEASQATQDTGKAIATDAKKTGEAAAKTAEAAGTEIKNTAANTKEAGNNALETSKVKSALDTAAGLDTQHIDVDTDTSAKTITLKGSVPDEKQKKQAETVAKGIAGNDFTVIDKLVVK
ncbi:MAG TPA: BON domain-containing protein [Fimbriimonadaceae bacterium]|nr:BON domain-containing protein [Fimbriimonadaceae bacterium]